MFFDQSEVVPWSADGVEGGDDARKVDGSPFRDFNFRDKDCQWQNNAVEEECEEMSYNLSDKEEAVDHIKLLEQSHFLQHQSSSHHYILNHIFIC